MAKNNTKKISMREKAKKSRATTKKSRRVIGRGASKVSSSARTANAKLKKEFHIPLPNNKLGRFLSRRGRLMPKFITESWGELKDVTWPSKNETYRLTVAVFVFSIVFGLIVAFLDVGLDKIFKELILK